LVDLASVGVVVGIIAGLLAIFLQLRGLYLSKKPLKVKALYGYHTGTTNSDADPLCIVILNRSTRKVFIHRYWIDSKPKTEKLPNIGKVKIRRRTTMSSPNDHEPFALEPSEKKILEFDGYSQAGKERAIQESFVHFVDSHGTHFKSKIGITGF